MEESDQLIKSHDTISSFYAVHKTPSKLVDASD